MHNHANLHAWGRATVLELEDGSGRKARCLCVEGRWSAVDELASLTATPSKWSCMLKVTAVHIGPCLLFALSHGAMLMGLPSQDNGCASRVPLKWGHQDFRLFIFRPNYTIII